MHGIKTEVSLQSDSCMVHCDPGFSCVLLPVGRTPRPQGLESKDKTKSNGLTMKNGKDPLKPKCMPPLLAMISNCPEKGDCNLEFFGDTHRSRLLAPKAQIICI